MSSSRGFALIAALGVMTFLMLSGVALLTRGLWQADAGFRTEHRSSALYLAEAAVDQAARNLRTPETSDDILTAALGTGTFQIEEQTPVASLRYRVTARGVSQQQQRRLEVILLLTPQSAFQFALFGSQNVTVSGNAITDSYDSRKGPYHDEDPESPAYNAGPDGDVGTNGVSAGGITVSGSIFVDGQLAVGPEVPDPASVVTGYDPAFITGGTTPPSDTQDVVSQETLFSMPSVSVPEGLACPDYTVAGNTTTTLSPGTYCYHDLAIQGNATLTASGSVTIYLTGSLTASGNSVVGAVDNPRTMTVLMASTSEAILEEGQITGSNKFYGSLYGPKATLTISGNAEVFGSVIAKSINVSGSAAIHRDLALSDTTNVTNTYTVARRAWRER